MVVDRNADEMDQTGRSAEREFAILGLTRRSELLRNIQAALRRMEDRTLAYASTVKRGLEAIV